MFEILKNKLKKAIKSISERIEKKEVEKPKEGGKPEKIFKKIKEKVVKAITEKELSEEEIRPILEELEADLIEADVAYEVAEKIKEDLKKNLVGKKIKRGKEKEVVVETLKQSLVEILSVPEIDLIKMAESKKPFVILFLGFNGSGKTSSLAKLGKFLIDSNHSCVFAAADTFRAASIEQLEEHGKNLGINVIKQKYGADPAAVAFDAIAHAKANNIDFVLIDTAGRAHTNKNLMEQMQKIIRVAKPDLKVLVLDSLTGNDAVLQARFFNEVGIDAVVFTKVDVNEKGGAILSVTHELKKPILYLTTGQDYKNVENFNPEEFVENLLR
jgi:fused signal recognition particle receptor